MNAFAKGLKILLIDKKQKDVAIACGMTPAQLSQVINGKNIQIETIEKICAGLKTPASAIFKKGEDSQSEHTVQ
ncbi:TPA: helix-turn-helix domain-containing protein [Vibrio cholerae]